MAYTCSVLRPVFTILVKYEKYLAYSLAWRDTLEEVDSRPRPCRSDFLLRVKGKSNCAASAYTTVNRHMHMHSSLLHVMRAICG